MIKDPDFIKDVKARDIPLDILTGEEHFKRSAAKAREK